MATPCPICQRKTQRVRPWGPYPCGTCAGLAERWDDYFHVPKLFTWRGVRQQLRGLRETAKAAVKNARGQTQESAERGRVRALGGLAKLWIRQWWVLQHRGWRHTRELYLYSDGPQDEEEEPGL